MKTPLPPIAPSPAATSLAAAMAAYRTAALSALIGEEAFARLYRLGERLPLALSGFWGYEIPLGKEEPQCDFLFCVHEPDVLAEAFNGAGTPAIDPGLLEDPIYRRLQSFAALWAGASPLLREVVVNVWFEYDFDDLGRPVPPPNFFFAPARQCNKLEILAAAHEIFGLLSDRPGPKEPYAWLLRALERLEDAGWIAQIGRMLARGENNLRLFVQDIPAGGIGSFLREMDYPNADDPALAAELGRCYPGAQRVDLDLDLLDGPGDKIGLECYFDTVGQALDFLDGLCEQGLCRPEKHRGLTAYLRRLRFDPAEDFQPFFSHFKLVFAPGAGFVAKAYVGYARNDLARSIIRTQPL